jgi:hypothetical protein
MKMTDYTELETFDFVSDEELFDVFDEQFEESFEEETRKLLAQF